MMTAKGISTKILSIILSSSIASSSEVQATPPANTSDGVGLYAYDRRSWNDRVRQDFPLVVVQLGPGSSIERKAAEIRELTASGTRVIIDFQFLERFARGKSRVPPALDNVQSRLFDLLDRLEGVPLEGISLDEENVLSSPQLAYLSQLYHVSKQRYPHRSFFQWAGTGRNLPTGLASRLAAVPADGWIIDPYHLNPTDYAALVAQMKGINARLYSVVWTSPSWAVDLGYRVEASPDWWNQHHWRIFYNRIAVNQREDVTTIVYGFGLEGEKVHTLWNGTTCDKRFFEKLTTVTIPYVSRHAIDPTIPDSIPDWMPTHCG